MKAITLKKSAVISFFIAVSLFSCYAVEEDNSRQKTLMVTMLQTLNSQHYSPVVFDDTFSVKVYNGFLKAIDFNKRFLTQSDIKQLEVFKYQIDDQIKAGTFEFFEKCYELYDKRLKKTNEFYEELLSKPINFTAEGIYEFDGKKKEFPEDEKAQLDEWRNYFTYQVVSNMAIDLDIQEQAKERKDTVIKVLTLAELEEKSREKVLKNHRDWFKRMLSEDKEERFSDYLNAIARAYDPHTDYYPPKDKENFDIQFTGQFEGIGATLTQRDGLIRVTNIVPGSASYRQGELKVDDVILKVGQGNEDPVDIVGMRVDEAVKYIRGKKGTTVKLTVRKPDGSIKVIPIVRDVVILEETYAKSAVLEHKNLKKRYGYIYLPSFYADFSNNRGGRNCYEDIKKEIAKLRVENISGLILDLRNNGGGSLQDVVKMSGLFINKGPIVQVKTKDGSPMILSDDDPEVQYDGPLVIMVNTFSASASEILAAAMQDYKRAIIVGSEHTYGKGTVQRIIDLGQRSPFGLLSSTDKAGMGSLKVTMQKFYRANGGSTQLRGVSSDIILPDIYKDLDLGEKELDNVMEWSQINPANFTPCVGYDRKFEQAKKKSIERVQKNPVFNLIVENAAKMKQRQDASSYPLNLDAFRAQQAKIKKEEEKFKDIGKDLDGIRILSLKLDEVDKDNPAKAEREKNFHKTIKKDIYIEEALFILNDIS
jgi:carboxyl-terminal processing protease